MTDEKKYKLAKKRVKNKKHFYRHLSVYIIIGVFFFLVNYFSSPNDWWFFWPLLPWGVGLSIHYIKIFGLTGAGLGTPEWEEREMEKEMSRLGISGPSTQTKESLDLDDHLQLKEVRKETADRYLDDDFV